MIEYIEITYLAYIVGSITSGIMWLRQGVQIMNDDELRTRFDYYWSDVLGCTIYGLVTSWFGVFMYMRYKR